MHISVQTRMQHFIAYRNNTLRIRIDSDFGEHFFKVPPQTYAVPWLCWRCSLLPKKPTDVVVTGVERPIVAEILEGDAGEGDMDFRRKPLFHRMVNVVDRDMQFTTIAQSNVSM